MFTFVTLQRRKKKRLGNIILKKKATHMRETLAIEIRQYSAFSR